MHIWENMIIYRDFPPKFPQILKISCDRRSRRSRLFPSLLDSQLICRTHNYMGEKKDTCAVIFWFLFQLVLVFSQITMASYNLYTSKVHPIKRKYRKPNLGDIFDQLIYLIALWYLLLTNCKVWHIYQVFWLYSIYQLSWSYKISQSWNCRKNSSFSDDIRYF